VFVMCNNTYLQIKIVPQLTSGLRYYSMTQD